MIQLHFYGTVKQETETCNLFCNIAEKRVEGKFCAFLTPTNQVRLLQVVVAESREQFYLLQQNLYILRLFQAQR